jgi:hypothetical protein
MIKSALLATFLAMAFVAPAYAASTLTCDEPTMTKMKTDIDAMTDKEKQTTSVKEWEMAMEEMKGNKLSECELRIRKMDEQNQSQ